MISSGIRSAQGEALSPSTKSKSNNWFTSMSAEYPTPGYYRILVDNPPPKPGPSTMFATNNGTGMQVTAAGSDGDDRLRQKVRTI